MIKTASIMKKLVVPILMFGCILAGVSPCYAGTDFNGDGKDDIVTFARETWSEPGRGNVYVALSTGSSFSGTGAEWHGSFCYALEIPATGDFNGDGKDDIACFIRNTRSGTEIGDVYVSLSDGTKFVGSSVWNGFFCINDEIPGVGDFNGDGKDDVIIFVRNAKGGAGRGDVYVALSTGGSFVGAGTWHDFFCVNTEIPAVGDFNGDGKDDIVAFSRETWSGDERADVYVALSTGSSFSGTGVKWHDFFCIRNEIPIVGDFNGDGKDDIAAFARNTSWDTTGDVYVALSTGSSFSGKGVLWNEGFGTGNSIPHSGDFDGDGKDDVLIFWQDHNTDYRRGDVKVAVSDGSHFYYAGPSQGKWHDWFSIRDEVPTTLAAAFPYYMFPESFENSSGRCGAYASNEEDRFWDNVFDFKDEFENTWPCSQYYWAYPHLLRESHLSYVDSVDIAYVSGHGDVSSITLCDGQEVNLRECSWGSWSSNSRRGDLEYIAFESCQTLSLGTHWRNRWQCTANRSRPFAGLHVACGYRNDHWESPVFELSDEFAENLEDGFSVRWAWLEASDDENYWVWGHNNIPCAIYVMPHKYERYWQHNTRDRWYHDSDYKLGASWLSY